MLSRKPAVLYSAWLPLGHSCTTSCRPARAHDLLSQTRPYAQHAQHPASHAHGQEADSHWPEAVPPHTSPTPYQLLGCHRGQAYTKHRFYSLVKLYHPDRCNSSSPVAHLPHAVRAERYRLLVAAHAILSDHAKRRAYDVWGLGWTGHHQTPVYPPPHTSPTDQRQWQSDPRHNATWEDWERWYQHKSGTESAEPRDLYMNNFAFVSLIFAIVTIGSVMQGTRATMLTSSAMEQHDRVHRQTSIQLARTKHATISGHRDERIRTFLEHRESNLAGDDAYQRLLPPSDSCLPDTVRKH